MRHKTQTLLPLLALLLGLFCAPSTLAQPGPYIASRWSSFTGSSFSSRSDKLVGTFVFYWYDVYTGQHMTQHSIRPNYDYATPIPFSYKSPDWWARELRNVAYCGVDLALMNYWTGAEVYWSNPGLDELNQGLNLMEAQQTRAPKIGLFYDTSSLRGTDLNTAAGKDRLYQGIREFYSRIRPDRWARIDNRVVVVLYKAGGLVNLSAAGAAFREAEARFASEFGGNRLFLIGSAGWRNYNVPIALSWEWGAAAQPDGTRITSDNIAGVAPGLTRLNGEPRLDRRQGATYRNGWEKVLRSAKRHVFIETWNELHEGTGVLTTREHGNRELQLTREYAKRFHAR